MKHAVSVAALLAFSTVGASADESDLRSELEARLRNSALDSIHRVQDLPIAVAELLDVNGTFSMADPGANWNPGCVRDSANPEPDRRLIVAGASPSIVAVFYDRGGYAVVRVLDLIALSANGEVNASCTYYGGPKLPALPELISAFPAGFEFNRCEVSSPPPNKALQPTARRLGVISASSGRRPPGQVLDPRAASERNSGNSRAGGR